jgi:hypothetical protein
MHYASLSRSVLAALCFLFVSVLGAKPSPEELAQTVLADLTRRDALPFTPYAMHVEEKAGGKTLSYEVRAPSEFVRRHTLVASGGKAATPKDAADFAKERDTFEAPKPDKGSIRIEHLQELIDAGSLVFEKMDGAKALFRFTHEQPFSADVSVKLGGRLVYDTALGYVSHMELFSTAPFMPDSKAKVRDFTFALDFVMTEGSERVVPAAIHTHIAGRALLVISFDETAEILFSGYRPL